MFGERYLSQFPALRNRLVRAAARMLGGQAEAEDVVQDTYLRALEAGGMPPPDSAQAWLTAVMRNLAVDRLRRDGWMQRWLREAGACAAGAPSAEADAAQAESIGQALRLVAARLSPAEGAAVLLREVFEASFKEIAQASGEDRGGAARQQLHRALLRLRQGKDGGRQRVGRMLPRVPAGVERLRCADLVRDAAAAADACARRVGCGDVRSQVRLRVVLPGDADRRTARPDADRWAARCCACCRWRHGSLKKKPVFGFESAPSPVGGRLGWGHARPRRPHGVEGREPPPRPSPRGGGRKT
jgi:RNA polymerase sigma factor (sigma-70 family)